MFEHKVRYNESLLSITHEYGMQRLSDIHYSKENEAFFNKRQLTNCLAPGDVLIIPTFHVPRKITVNAFNTLIVEDHHYDLPVTLVDGNLNPLVGLEVRCVWEGADAHLASQSNANGIATFTLPAECEIGLLAYQWQGQTVHQPFKLGTLLPPEMNEGMAQRWCNVYGQPFDAGRAAQGPDRLPEQIADGTDDTAKPPNELLTLLIGNE